MKYTEVSRLSGIEAANLALTEQNEDECPIDCHFIIRNKLSVLPDSQGQPDKPGGSLFDPYVDSSDKGEGV